MGRRDAKNSAILFFASLAVYSWHLSPGLTAEDSGNFLMGAKHLGTIHPPGYPLYVLLAFLFGKIPVGEFAARVNFMSAVFASGALVAFYLAQRIWLRATPLIAGCSALAVGLHFLFWSEAEVAEVYTLNAFLLAVVTVLIGRFTVKPDSRLLAAAALVFALGLANHYPLMLLSAVPLIAFTPSVPRSLKDHFTKVSVFFLLGLLPYLLLVLNATLRSPEYNFGKLASLDMVFTHILRSQYSAVDQAGGTVLDKLLLAAETTKSLGLGFGVYSVALLLGLVTLIKSGDRNLRGLLPALFSTWLLLLLLLGFTADERHVAIFEAYMLPTVLFSGFLVTMGLQRIEGLWRRKWPTKSLAFTLVLGISLSLAYPLNVGRASHRQDLVVAKWARALLTSLEPKTSVILCGTDVFAVYYTHFIEGVRPDLKLYDQFSVFTKENLYGELPLFQRPDPLAVRKRYELALTRDGSNPVVYLCSDSPQEIGLRVEPLPYGFRVGPPITPRSLRDEDEDLLAAAAAPSTTKEYWLKLRRQVIFSQMINYFGVTGDEPALAKVLRHFKDSDLADDDSLVFRIANNLALNKRYPQSLEFFQSFDRRRFPLGAEDFSNICGMLIQTQRLDEALQFCQRGLDADQGCHKGLRRNLAYLFQLKGDLEKSRALLSQCP